MVGSDGVPGGFGGVVASRWCGPAEGPVRQLVYLPPGVLLEPVVMPAFGAAITKARPAARLVRDVVFEVALAGGAAADTAWARGGPRAGRAGVGGVLDLAQGPQRGAGVVAAGGEPVVAVLGAERVQLDDQVR